MRIALAKEHEAPLVYAIMMAAFEEFRGNLEPPSSAHDETIEDVRRAMATGGAALAWDDETAIGSARFQLRPDFLYVGRLAVLPLARGRSVAAAMMAFLGERARLLGLPEVRVEVRLSLPENVAFFRRLDFQTVSEQPHPRGPAYWTVILGKRV